MKQKPIVKPPKVSTLPKGNYKEGETYTLTLNPKDDYQHFLSNEIHRDRNCMKSMLKLLEGLNSVADYTLYPEWSKTKGRFHVHGTITFKDVYLYSMIYGPRLSSKTMVEIDVINDKDKWQDYCTKDEWLMKPSFQKKDMMYPIVYKPPKKEVTIMDKLNKFT